MMPNDTYFEGKTLGYRRNTVGQKKNVYLCIRISRKSILMWYCVIV